MPLYRLENAVPVLHPSAYVAPTASIVGDVALGESSSVWFNTVVRGDSDRIVIGEASNVQDLCMLHVDPGKPLSIGSQVTIGHRCVIHGCQIEDQCLIGMGAIIMNGARIGHGSIVAAGSVVLEDTVVPSFSLVTGIPARVKKTLDKGVLERVIAPARTYVERAKVYQSAALQCVS